MDKFFSAVSSGISTLAANADKLAIGYSGILAQRQKISLMKAQSAAQLAALQAQAADANAQAAIANASANTTFNNPTATGTLSQLKNSPLIVAALGLALLGGVYFIAKAKG